MYLDRIERKYARVTVAAVLDDGTPATLTGVDVALLPRRTTPTAATTWVPASYEDGVARILLAGPDADPAGAIVVPAAGADFWVRVVDTPEVDTARIDTVIVV